MKKIILAVALMAAVSTSAVAENNYKPEAGSFATELNYSFGGEHDGAFELPDQDNYGIKLRYFLNDNWVIRLNFGLGTSSTKNTTYNSLYEDPADPSKVTGETEDYNTTKTTTFSIMPGFEYHFNKFNRISPYVGAEIGIRTSTRKTITEIEKPESRTEVKNPGLGFCVNAITGVDVYIVKGLYVGAELGLGYDMMNYKRGTTTTEAGGTSNEEESNNSTRESSFKFSATPSLRIGWFF